ncbi:MAG: hypothetical protein U5K32_10185 [Bacteroidales bacterium]|nr:hypothetical protein [Bacteroidales bacterium]
MDTMKHGKLKDLLLRSLSSELESDERDIIDREIVSDRRFSEGFRERVMSRIVSGKIYINGKREMIRSFDKVFMRVAIPGAAAILLLVLSLLLSQGSLSYDTLLGY